MLFFCSVLWCCLYKILPQGLVNSQFQSKKIKEKEAGFISLMFLITDLDTYIQ
jgi:hypothetical protein